MSDYLTPIKYNNPEEQDKKAEEKPPPPPTHDRFKRLVKRDAAPPPKEEMEQQSAEMEESDLNPPSLFDLAQNKTKAKSSATSTKEDIPTPPQESSDESLPLTQGTTTKKESPLEKSPLETPKEPTAPKTSLEEPSPDAKAGTGKESPLPTSPEQTKNIKDPQQPVDKPSIENSSQQNIDVPKKPQTKEEVPQDKKLAAQSSETQEKKPANLQETQTVKPPQPQSTQGDQELSEKQSAQGIPNQNAQTSKGGETDNVQKKDSTFVKEKKTETTETIQSGRADQAVQSNVNTTVQGVGLGAEKAQNPEKSASATLADLATQLIETIQTMRKEDKTETIITLKSPPMLAGASVTLIASDNAKREFNISFGSLTNAAKMFLDQKLAENSLTDALERKGITIHMINTSTEPHPALNIDTGQTANQEREQQQRDQQEQRRQQDQENPEEEQ